ncbi:MAG: outer membrane protein assembly factor BamE [Betaproteobacteria bacterium]|nr:outer membrane protein assembly factor BamE [Betaproteobacteria bacterium]
MGATPRYNARHFPDSIPMRLLASLALSLALAGCGPIVHRIDIQQGNLVAPETFAQLKVGMTKSEVRRLLGTPLVTDVFHAERWDYYFRNEKRGRLVEQNKFAVHFEKERMVRVEGGPTLSAAGGAPVK